MPRQQQKKSGGARKIGRNVDKCRRYRDMHRREVNKIKRVLQSCGAEFAKAWAREHHVEGVLSKLMAQRGGV